MSLCTTLISSSSSLSSPPLLFLIPQCNYKNKTAKVYGFIAISVMPTCESAHLVQSIIQVSTCYRPHQNSFIIPWCQDVLLYSCWFNIHLLLWCPRHENTNTEIHSCWFLGDRFRRIKMKQLLCNILKFIFIKSERKVFRAGQWLEGRKTIRTTKYLV